MADMYFNSGELWTEQLHRRFACFAANAREQLVIAAPFITRRALEEMLRTVTVRDVIVVTTWRAADILRGSSDLELYPYLRSRGWELRLHKHLHAKLIVVDWRSAIISTANITQRGIGLVEPGNLECAHLIGSLRPIDQFWVLTLVGDSSPMEDEWYTEFLKWLRSSEGKDASKLLKDGCVFDPRKRHVLSTTGVPATRSPRQLLANLEAILRNGVGTLAVDARRATLHDVSLLALEWGDLRAHKVPVLRDRFFKLPIVQDLLGFIDGGRYFGEVKHWLRQWSCEMPPLKRRDLTSCVQVLFTWLVELESGSYEVRRPHYSQFITPIPVNGALLPTLGEDVYGRGAFETPPYRCTGL